MLRNTLLRRFELPDLVLIGFHGLALLLLAPSYTEVADWPTACLQSTGLILGTFATALWLDRISRPFALAARALLTIFSCIWGYERANALVRLIHGQPSIEGWFLQADLSLFGGHASVWTQALHHPWLTEWLQICYVAYFLLPLIVAIFVAVSGRWHHMPLLVFAVLFATHQNFIFYVLVPVRSPFLIADLPEFAGYGLNYGFELHGLWFTDSLRQGLLDATTMRYDCFPSGHTCLTLVTMAMAWRMHRAAFWTISPIGVSLVFSTLYLRYHYLVDIFAGLAMAGLIVWASPRLIAWWARARGAAERDVRRTRPPRKPPRAEPDERDVQHPAASTSTALTVDELS